MALGNVGTTSVITPENTGRDVRWPTATPYPMAGPKGRTMWGYGQGLDHGAGAGDGNGGCNGRAH